MPWCRGRSPNRGLRRLFTSRASRGWPRCYGGPDINSAIDSCGSILRTLHEWLRRQVVDPALQQIQPMAASTGSAAREWARYEIKGQQMREWVQCVVMLLVGAVMLLTIPGNLRYLGLIVVAAGLWAGVRAFRRREGRAKQPGASGT